ncbi:MAG: IPT/TIG domain-containing protein [Vicinamibacterales bacterium]
MIVKFNPMKSGYSRLIDFSNSTLDTGIYELDGGLSLYPVGTFAPASFADNQYSFVTFTRDGATNVVSVFVGTTPAGTYTDTGSLYVPSAQNVIYLMDNTTGSANIFESSPGVITYIKLIDTPVTAGQIAALQTEACSTVVAPSVSGINPPSGPTSGGTIVTITGTKLTGATAVSFGANAATSFSVDSDTQITATSPAGIVGVVDVTVTTPSGPSSTGANDKFTYVVAGVAPTAATTAATGITVNGATLNGTVSANGASTTVTFGYGLTAGYGTSIAATQSPLAGSASGAAVSAAISGLSCNTLYHFHVTANNGTGGTIDGGDLTFTTAACPTFAITAVANPTGGGTVLCTPNPVASGGNSVCTATPNAGFNFINWTGGCSGTSCTLLGVTSPISVTANFAPVIVPLPVNSIPTLSKLGVWVLAGLLALSTTLWMRRRRTTRL